VTAINGTWLDENDRMKLLRAEEFEALGMWEIPNNALLTARISLHPAQDPSQTPVERAPSRDICSLDKGQSLEVLAQLRIGVA
jgi:hypothetical protein